MTTAQAKRRLFDLNLIGERVLVRPAEASDVTDGGIHLPEPLRNEGPRTGLLVIIAEDCETLRGYKDHYGAADLRVWFEPYAGHKIEMDGQEYLVMKADDIIMLMAEE